MLRLPCRMGHVAPRWRVADGRRLCWLLLLHAILETPLFSDADLQLLID